MFNLFFYLLIGAVMPHGRDRTVVGFITSYDCMQSVRGVLDTTLSDKSLSVTCASLVFLWFPPPIKLSDCHCITEIFLKVALNTITIRVITKLPNIEQSSKGKGKTHKSINRQNQSTTGKLGKPYWPPTWYRHF